MYVLTPGLATNENHVYNHVYFEWTILKNHTQKFYEELTNSFSMLVDCDYRTMGLYFISGNCKFLFS